MDTIISVILFPILVLQLSCRATIVANLLVEHFTLRGRGGVDNLYKHNIGLDSILFTLALVALLCGNFDHMSGFVLTCTYVIVYGLLTVYAIKTLIGAITLIVIKVKNAYDWEVVKTKKWVYRAILYSVIELPVVILCLWFIHVHG